MWNVYQELPGMWYEINHMVFFTRKQNAREWKKSDVGISHQTENEKKNFVYAQKEAAPPTAAAAAAAEKQKEEKMPKTRSNMYVYSSTRIFGLIFENEKTTCTTGIHPSYS